MKLAMCHSRFNPLFSGLTLKVVVVVGTEQGQ